MAEQMKLNIALLTLDIDGTLMNAQKQFPENNRRALQACEARGIRIALVSGRSFELMRGFARDLGIHPILCACNGARIDAGENGDTLMEHSFKRSDAERVCRALERSGLYFNVYRRGKAYQGNPHVRLSLGERYAHHVVGICGEAGYEYETVCDWERLWGEGLEGVYKFVAMGQPYDPAFETLKRELADMQLSVSSASRRNCEFMPTGVDKGLCVRFLCKWLGVDAKQVMAFGDQTNDIPMLREAGYPVAMENGEDSVKACARIIAPDHNLGGVGLVLEEYVL